MSCGCYEKPCGCSKPKVCGCEIDLDTKCIKWSGTCAENIPIQSGDHLETIICAIDTIIGNLLDKITDFIGINVGDGSKVYKGNDIDGFPEFRTLGSTVSVNVTQNEDTITFSVDESWLEEFIVTILGSQINLDLSGEILQIKDAEGNVITSVDLSPLHVTTVDTNLNGTELSTTINGVTDIISLRPLFDRLQLELVGDILNLNYGGDNLSSIDLGDWVTEFINNNPDIICNISENCSSDNPPKAINLSITGNLQEGQQITGNYTYTDEDGDLESCTTFQWYTSDAPGGILVPIAGATNQNYTLTANEINKFITFGVTPCNLVGVGQEETVETIGVVIGLGVPPVANITLETEMPSTGGVLFSLSGTDSDGTIASWTLDLGDGSPIIGGTGAPQDAEFPPTFHNYTTTGSYEMVLTVTDNDGLSDTDTKSIIVNSNLNSKACISGNVYAKKNETGGAPDAILDLNVIITDKNGSPAVSGDYRIINVKSNGNTAIIDGSSGPFTNFTGNNFTINRNLEVYPQLPIADPIDEIRIEFLVGYQDGGHSFIPWVATYGLSSEDTSNDYFPPGSSGVPFFKGTYNIQCDSNSL